ncbi:MAG: histidine kinase [Lachnospiraceae bacterium]|nr:histidine kinase [Lachnospiraceae bacterium]
MGLAEAGWIAFGTAMVFSILLLIMNKRLMDQLSIQGRRMKRQKGDIEKKEAVIRNLQTSIALSQIKPHFLYNALNSIYVLCGKDLAKGRQAISDLSDYLRMNIGSIESKLPIPFEKEMEHVKKYLAIEEMRFPDEFTVSILTPVTDFMLPALSLQPLVENAVKYGVVPKGEGGIILISSRETDKEYIVTVVDNGAGFDTMRLEALEDDDSPNHIGIINVRERLQRLSGGQLEIRSTIDYGTEAIIRIPKTQS